MVMIKIFEDLYMNSDRIDQIAIEPEDYDKENITVWNVEAKTMSDGIVVTQLLGQFDSMKEASEAVEKLCCDIGVKIVEFAHKLNQCLQLDSNQPPDDYKSTALPNEL